MTTIYLYGGKVCFLSFPWTLDGQIAVSYHLFFLFTRAAATAMLLLR